ncbi:NUDIX hydrolase [Pseudothermotoga sp.]|nr:CoA pyrophosphatase [Pseudothermotoga sp.]MDW8139503.1 CoA pyrophosphatase [Pseudothermotoga sp.]
MVAVPIVHLFGSPYVVLIRRARRLKRHPNQVAFPGGIVEENESMVDALFRELEEEVGVLKQNCKLLGKLSPTVTAKSNLYMQPFLVKIELPHFRLNRNEVEDIYFIELKLFEENHCEEIVLPKGGKTFRFKFGDLVVWGATARIMRNSFLQIEHLLEGYRDELPRNES